MSTPHLHTIKIVLFGAIIISITIALLTVLFPAPAHLDTTVREYHMATFITTLFSLLHVGAAVLFLLGLKIFQPRLRQAYMLICIALIVLCFNFLQYQIFVSINLLESSWLRNGGAGLVHIVSLIIWYDALFRFAQLLDIKSYLVSKSFIGALCLVAGLVGYWLAHGPLNIAVSPLDITLASEFILLALATIVLLIALRIKQNLGPAYTNAMAWLVLALAAQIVALLLPTIFEINQLTKGPILGIPVVISGVLFIRAGYVFNKISSY